MNYSHIPRSRRRGGVPVAIFFVLTVIAAGAGATWFFLSQGETVVDDGPLTHRVEEAVFIHDVVEQGEVESSNNIEVRCDVKMADRADITILWVVPEGTNVKKGDELVKLDSSGFEKEMTQQEIVVTQTEALKIQAESAYEAAIIAKQEYLEGTFKQEEQTILNEVFTAKENLQRAELSAQSAERLAAKGMVRLLQMEADKFAVDKAENELRLAETKLNVLREFTKSKMLKQLEADIVSAKAKLNAELKSYQLEVEKLEEIRQQIELCDLKAPADGQVVHANKFSSRGNSEFVVEEGATVREQQVIIRLPDSQNMQVKATVNESQVTMVKEGMPVSIRLDAFEDLHLGGEVTKVNKYAEPGGWTSGGIKEYATYIRIIDPPANIRSGMNAAVSIHVEHIPDALSVPVQAVCQHKGHFFCMVKQGPRWETRKIEVGSNNESFVMINNGLEVGDQVALSPRSYPDLLALPDLPDPREQLATAMAKKARAEGAFSENKPDQDAAPSQSGGPGLGEPGSGGQRPGPGGGAGGPGPGGADFNPAAVVGRIMERLDKDGDGAISSEEMAADTSGRVSASDTDGDGSITRSELLAAMRERMQQGGAGGGGE